MITLSDENYQEIPTEFLQFPGGEEHVRITPKSFPRNLLICADLLCSSDVIKLLLLVDATKRLWGDLDTVLVCPYLPYARQDRVANRGESLSIDVMCRLINSCRFKEVKVWDAHSDVSLALLRNSKNVPPDTWTSSLIQQHHVLIAPDAGAAKKVYKCAKPLSLPVVIAEKQRDTKTGTVSNVRIHDNSLMYRSLLIIDDICDGGSTFIQLAKELRKQQPTRIDLYVTHGIFSKGLHVFKGLIDTVYCPNVWPNVDKIRQKELSSNLVEITI